MNEDRSTARVADEPKAESQADRPGQPRGAEAETIGRSALVDPGDSDRFQERWREVQNRFVDAPERAVQDADALVAELMHHLSETFATERSSLERQWTRGDDVSTEDLRLALTRYRSFFDRLLEA